MLRPEIWLADERPKDLAEEQEKLWVSLMVIRSIVDPDEASELFEGNPAEGSEEEARLWASLLASLPLAFENIKNHGTKLDKERQARMRDLPFGPPQPIRSTKVGRNELCPCNSGKKYKKCCGQGDKVVPIR